MEAISSVEGKCRKLKMSENKKIQKETAAQWIIMGSFFLILLVLQVFVHVDFGDDLTYRSVWAEKHLGEFLRDRYEWWSSRVVIEAVMMPLVAAPVWIWRILNILMVLLLVWNTADMFGMEGRNNKLQAQIFFFILMWTVPMVSLRSAGWITTTTNYLWVLTLGLAAMRPIKHWVCQEKCAKWEYLICPLCTLYGANMEQMGAILLGVYLVFGLYLIAEKRRLSPFYIIQLLLIIAVLYFVLAAPGNDNRNRQEIERAFPEFAQLGVWEKLAMGFIESTQYYVAAGYEQVSYLFALLTGVLFAAVLQGSTENTDEKAGQNTRLRILVALIPLAFYWGVGHLGNYLLARGAFPRGGHIVGLFGGNRQLPGLGQYSPGMVAMQILLYLMLLGCVALTIYFIHGKKKETLLELVILAAGLASRVIIGFSPTIYASGDRTALFCSMAMLIVTLRNLQFFWNGNTKWYGKAVLGAYAAVIIAGNLQ